MEHPTICRRDIRCICKICTASIIATLDLIPPSSFPFPSPPKTPLYFSSSSTISTPESTISFHPRLNMNKTDTKSESFSGNFTMSKCVIALLLISIATLGFSFLTSIFMESKFSQELVTTLGHKSLSFHDHVNEQLGFLNKEFQILGGNNIFPKNPNWEIIQDGLILRSRFRIFESGIEEVSIWGWNLQTTGLVTTKSDSRSFTILSGRVTQWSNGESNYSTRKANTSWEQPKWSAYIWRLNENTLILEYRRRFEFDKKRPLMSAFEFLKFKIIKSFHWLQKSSQGYDHLTPT